MNKRVLTFAALFATTVLFFHGTAEGKKLYQIDCSSLSGIQFFPASRTADSSGDDLSLVATNYSTLSNASFIAALQTLVDTSLLRITGVSSLNPPGTVLSVSIHVGKNSAPEDREISFTGPLYTARIQQSGIEYGGANFILKKTYATQVNASQRVFSPLGNLVGREYSSDIEYYDGLGYQCASISLNAGGAFRHLTTPVECDTLRRTDSRVFLPFIMEGDDISWNGLTSLKVQQLAYWSSVCGYTENRPFIENHSQRSPVGRRKWTMQSGHEYAAANKKIVYSKRLNIETDHILKLDYIIPTQTYTTSLPFTVSGQWPAGSLVIEETVDEDQRRSITVKDVWNKVLCTRSFPSASDTLDTYYVHDMHDNVVCIIQPDGSSSLKSVNPDFSEIEPFCFQYRYDGAGNKLRQKVPGGCWEDFYYDSRDRLIASTDEELLINNLFRWAQYDSLDHVIKESYVKCPGKTASAVRNDLLYGTMVFDYQPDINKIPIIEKAYYSSGYSLPSGMELNGYSGIVSSSEILALYGYPAYEKVYELPNLDGTVRNNRSYVERSFGYNSLGQLVVAKERDNNRLDNIQMTIWYKYDQLGNVTRSVEHHTPLAEAPIGTLYTWNDYDDRGKRIRTTRKIDSANLSEVEYSYDDMGRLSNKTVTSSVSQAIGRQSVEYNLQERQSGSTALLGSEQVFREDLHYHNSVVPLTTPQWAGNISEYLSAQGSMDTQLDAYSYDGVSRLTGRRSSGYDGEITIGAPAVEAYSYNPNGSVASFSSGQWTASPARSFTYSGTRLTAASDMTATPSPVSFSYSYDSRGNRVSDSRNGVNITYNTLNLPSSVMKTDHSDSAKFVYLADGTKMKVIDKSGHTMRYRGSFVIKQNTETADESVVGALWDEGFTELSGSWWSGWTAKDIWYVKDYLGNVRGKYDLSSMFAINNAASRELSRSNYTPYGERIDASTTPQSTSYGTVWNDLHRFHFGGKEEIGESNLNLLDFGARYYDQFSFSWTTLDPCATVYTCYSPYAFCIDNPTNMADLDGRLSIFPIPYPMQLSAIGCSLERTGTNRTTKTIGYSIQQPLRALKIGPYAPYLNNITSLSAHFAINLSNSMGYPKSSTEGDVKNAIRHTIWQGILTSSYGTKEAERIGLNHEDMIPDTSLRSFTSQKEADTVADLLNNAIGQHIGGKGGDNLMIALQTINTLYNEGLWVVELQEGNFVVTRIQISEDQYKAAINEISKLNQYGHEK